MAGLLGGGGGGLRGHGELPLNADINVTSLVDVAFVLLIIFMITAPIMQGGVDVRLLRAQVRAYYKDMGWSEDEGRPTPETLSQLGIAVIA